MCGFWCAYNQKVSLKKLEGLLPNKKKLRNHINTTQLISLTQSYGGGVGVGEGCIPSPLTLVLNSFSDIQTIVLYLVTFPKIYRILHFYQNLRGMVYGFVEPPPPQEF